MGNPTKISHLSEDSPPQIIETSAASNNDFGPVILLQGQNITFVSFGLFVGIGTFIASLQILFYLGTYQILSNTIHIYQLAFFMALGAPMSAYIITRLLDMKTWLRGEKSFGEYIRTVSFGLWGGLIGGLSILLGFAALTQTPLLGLLDGFAVGIPLAQMFGRIGCLNYGCCHGKECSSSHQFGIRYFNAETKVLRYDPCLKGKRLFPTQIYSALGNLTIYLIILSLWLIWDTRPVGVLAATYMSLYGLKRFSVEFLRGEFPRVNFFGFTLWQWFSLSFVFLGSLLFAFVLNSHEMVGHGNFTFGFLNMQAALGLTIIASIIFGLAYGTHGKKIGSW